jgi:hypothetical protein
MRQLVDRATPGIDVVLIIVISIVISRAFRAIHYVSRQTASIRCGSLLTQLLELVFEVYYMLRLWLYIVLVNTSAKWSHKRDTELWRTNQTKAVVNDRKALIRKH